MTGSKAGRIGGIGIGSTRGEVRKAFGEPDRIGAGDGGDDYLEGGFRIRQC